MSEKKRKPGVMLYFDILPSLDLLTDEEMGQMFRAILYFGKEEREPDFSEKLHMQLLWQMLKPRLTTDTERYLAHVEQCRAAAYSRWNKEKGIRTHADHANST